MLIQVGKRRGYSRINWLHLALEFAAFQMTPGPQYLVECLAGIVVTDEVAKVGIDGLGDGDDFSHAPSASRLADRAASIYHSPAIYLGPYEPHTVP